MLFVFFCVVVCIHFEEKGSNFGKTFLIKSLVSHYCLINNFIDDMVIFDDQIIFIHTKQHLRMLD